MAIKSTNSQDDRYKVSWEEFDASIRELAKKISAEEFSAIYGIPRGGLVIATYLSHLLSLPLILKLEKQSKALLIVDDVSDSGLTLTNICVDLDWKEVKYKVATLHRKDGTIFEPDYCIKTINAWIIYPYEGGLNGEERKSC